MTQGCPVDNVTFQTTQARRKEDRITIGSQMDGTVNDAHGQRAEIPMTPGSNTWLGVRAEIMRRIGQRIYQPGELIPTELALAEEFGCARATVNRALTSLAERGVLERRRRIGTRVAAGMNQAAAPVTLPIMRHLVEARGHQFAFKYCGVTGSPLPRQVRERLFRSDPKRLQEHVTMFYCDDALLCAERRWLDSEVFPQLTPKLLQTVTLNEWLAENGGLTQMERKLSARLAGEVQVHALLGCPANAPVLVYHRCLWVGPRPVSYGRHAFVPGFGLEEFVT